MSNDVALMFAVGRKALWFAVFLAGFRSRRGRLGDALLVLGAFGVWAL
jgi:hypothetical protein